MSTDPAVEAAAKAACDGSHGWEQPCSLCVEFAERAVPAIRERIAADIEAEVMARIGHIAGQPCHHLYSRCFPTDDSLLEYRVRQREHGARKERERIAAEIKARADEDGTWIGPTDPDSILRFAARIARGQA